MSATSTHEPDDPTARGAGTIFDLSGIDLDACAATREQMLTLIPHRHEMALLDRIIWHDDALLAGVACMDIRGDEFWVRGHFPQKPMLPGVVMIEAGAQLACYLHNKRMGALETAAFLRIDDAAFRRSVGVGERMILLCKAIRSSERRFISNIQGIVEGRVCFESKIAGMRISTG